MTKMHDYRSGMQEEARRSKERVRQLLAIQIEAQIAQEGDLDDCSSTTFLDVSRTGEYESIGA